MSVSIIIGLLFSAWAVVHSLLASKSAKSWAASRFGASTNRYYRTFFVLFATATLAPVLFLVFITPGTLLYTVPAPWRYAMMGIQAIGGALLGWTLIITGTADFIGIPGAQRKDGGRLQTRGPYGYVRHPMYTASLAAMWFTPTMPLNVLVLFLCMTLYFILGSIHEELLLSEEYGEEYAAYRKIVPRFFPVRMEPYRPRDSRSDDGAVGEP